MISTPAKAYDLAILGSGFAGSLMAMIARRLGLSVLLLERGSHPRVVIGESSTPLANLLLEELALEYDLPQLLPLTKWGSWQRVHPQVGCGLKRGFTFYHHQPDELAPPWQRRDAQMLVAASPHDDIADTHWYRAEFDLFLLQQATALGANYVDDVQLHTYHCEQGAHWLSGTRAGAAVSYCAHSLLDASGPRGALHHLLRLREAPLSGMPATQALYNHFRGVRRCVSHPDAAHPYPPDDAAVHHLFDGGWVWMLRFANGVTSAGVVACDATADELQLCEGSRGWDRLLRRLPSVAALFRTAVPERAFRWIPCVAYLSETLAGDGWALLPSAAGAIDPLLSTGIPLTLLGIARIANILGRYHGLHGGEAELQQYAQQTRTEMRATASLIGALYATMSNPHAFHALCLLYFAAASYAETARRLGRAERAQGFLLCNTPGFAEALQRLCGQAREVRPGPSTTAFVLDVRQAIAPYDVAGLTGENPSNHYPVRAEDAIAAAHKLDATEAEMRGMLARCGFRA